MIPLIIALSALIAVLAALLFITHHLIQKRFGVRCRYPEHPVADYFYDAYQERYPRRRESFLSGKNRLQAYLYGMENAGGPLLVFAHGIGAGHESYIQEILWMVDHGWRVFAYDATGCCTSEGKGTRGLVQSALDLHAALSYIEGMEEFKSAPICLMGHSWGGYATAAVLGFSHKVTASVSISGYHDPVQMMMQFATATMGKMTVLLYPFAWLDTFMTFGKYVSLSAVRSINKSEIPVMVVQGAGDDLVTPTGASVMAHADQITNPHVVYRIMSDSGQDGHISLFYHKDSLSYIQAFHAAQEELFARYDKNHVPKEARQAFFAGQAHLDEINRPNDALLGEIQAFFEQAIQDKPKTGGSTE